MKKTKVTCIYGDNCKDTCADCEYFWSEQYEEEQALAAYEEDLTMRVEEYQKIIDEFND